MSVDPFEPQGSYSGLSDEQLRDNLDTDFGNVSAFSHSIIAETNDLRETFDDAVAGVSVVRATGDYEVGRAYLARDLFVSGGIVYVVAHDYTSVSLDQDMANGHVGVFQGLTRDELSDTELSLSRGAGIVYRTSRQLFSFDELLAVSGRYDGDAVYLVSYWKDYPVRESGGNFVWREGAATTDYGTVAAPPGSSGYWERDFTYAAPEHFGAVGQALPLNIFFDTLEEARVRYPHAYELTDLIDWAATREVFYLARTPAWIIGCRLKTYYLNRKVPIRDRELTGACKGFIGAGPWRSTFVFQNSGNLNDVFPPAKPTGTPTSEMESLYVRDEEASVQLGFVSSNFNENSEIGGWSDVVFENITIQGPAHGVCILLANGGRVRTRWCQFNGSPRVAFVSCNNIAMSWNENMFSGAAGTLARIGLLNLSNSYREITHSAGGVTGGGGGNFNDAFTFTKNSFGGDPRVADVLDHGSGSEANRFAWGNSHTGGSNNLLCGYLGRRNFHWQIYNDWFEGVNHAIMVLSEGANGNGKIEFSDDGRFTNRLPNGENGVNWNLSSDESRLSVGSDGGWSRSLEVRGCHFKQVRASSRAGYTGSGTGAAITYNGRGICRYGNNYFETVQVGLRSTNPAVDPQIYNEGNSGSSTVSVEIDNPGTFWAANGRQIGTIIEAGNNSSTSINPSTYVNYSGRRMYGRVYNGSITVSANSAVRIQNESAGFYEITLTIARGDGSATGVKKVSFATTVSNGFRWPYVSDLKVETWRVNGNYSSALSNFGVRVGPTLSTRPTEQPAGTDIPYIDLGIQGALSGSRLFTLDIKFVGINNRSIPIILSVVDAEDSTRLDSGNWNEGSSMIASPVSDMTGDDLSPEAQKLNEILNALRTAGLMGT